MPIHIKSIRNFAVRRRRPAEPHEIYVFFVNPTEQMPSSGIVDYMKMLELLSNSTELVRD